MPRLLSWLLFVHSRARPFSLLALPESRREMGTRLLTLLLLPFLRFGSSAREKTSTHLLVIRQVVRETRTPGQREEKKKKSRRRPPLPQVQVGSLRFRPPGDEIGPGHIGGASLRVSDWRRAVLRCLRIRLLGETVEKTGGQETEALGGLR